MSLPLLSQEEDVGQGCAGDLREGGLGCRGLFWDPGSCGWALPSLLMLQLIWRCWAEPGRVVKLNWEHPAGSGCPCLTAQASPGVEGPVQLGPCGGVGELSSLQPWLCLFPASVPSLELPDNPGFRMQEPAR